MKSIIRTFLYHPQPPDFSMVVEYWNFGDAGYIVIKDDIYHDYDLSDYETRIHTSIPIHGDMLCGSINAEFRSTTFLPSPYSPSNINSKPDIED